MRAVTIITSAAFVNTEIAAEFGSVPPSFLPIGHGRLYELQILRVTPLMGRVVLTVPESFEILGWDLSYLHSHGVEILAIPDGLSLGESILFAVLATGALGEVRILHGDTAFLSELPTQSDCVSVSSTSSPYSWGAIDKLGHFREADSSEPLGSKVLTGYFSFSRGSDLARSLTSCRNQFLEALEFYSTLCVSLNTCEIGGWLDCGHLQTYYAARAHVTTARAFNLLTISRHVVEKQSPLNEQKVRNEASWFERLPPMLRLHTPTYLGSELNSNGEFCYKLGYEHSPTLHELFVFGRLGKPTWRRITESSFEFLNRCSNFCKDSEGLNSFSAQVVKKTEVRLEEFARSSGTSMDNEWCYAKQKLPSLNRILQTTSDIIERREQETISLIHGDFCFPNIFYSSREEIIKVIDPRGSIEGLQPDSRGDLRYDLAKFNHSLEGYDLILAKRYILEINSSNDLIIAFPQEGPTRWLADLASQFRVGKHRICDIEVRALTIHLFLSMLPLHQDRPDRQRAFLANALRLYSSLKI